MVRSIVRLSAKIAIIAIVGLTACALAVLPEVTRTPPGPNQATPPANAAPDAPTPPAAPAPPKRRVHPMSQLPIIDQQFGGQTFALEVAASNLSVQRGLGKRTDIPEGTGMLFVYPISDRLSFWMYDCVIDMDIAFLDARGVVTAMYTMKKEDLRLPGEADEGYRLRLQRYPSVRPARFAIETRAGTNARLGIKVGDQVALDIPAIDKMMKW